MGLDTSAYYCEILDTLVTSFNLKLNNMETDTNSPICYATDNGSIVVKEMKFELCRFRLTGSLSTSILYNCFECQRRRRKGGMDKKDYSHRDNIGKT
ncbi:hypothetical protein NQ318_011987 [Aromia moschata]|uniref:Uncharacterized protein n=1 Tax=Aromia moschata TaxID=1265417 RepID=A0AAV8XZ71_9CUCU|nr:hypothetical protein NQ318_011987 [Aromia moschata]